MPALIVAGTLAAAVLFALALDLIKVPVCAHLGMAKSVAISATDGQKSHPPSTTPSAAEQSNPANAKHTAKAAPEGNTKRTDTIVQF